MLSWSQIHGHARVKEVLERAITQDRTHHALLMTGPSGVGKRQLALALIAILNCTARPLAEFKEACGSCPSCRKLGQLAHPDLLIVEPQGNKVKTIKIDQIREIQKAATTAPFEARERVVLIDDAHLMNDEAANALLKTLEEPTNRMRLMLITDQPHLLLDTIISRCQMLRFGSLELDAVKALLPVVIARTADMDKPSAAMIEVAAGFGEGSVGRSLAVLQSGILAEREELLRELVALEPDRPLPTLELAERWSKQNPRLPEQLELLQVFMRDVMLYKISASGDKPKDKLINSDLVRYIEPLSQAMSLDDVLAAIDLLRQTQATLNRHVNSQLLMEDLLSRFSQWSGKARVRPSA